MPDKKIRRRGLSLKGGVISIPRAVSSAFNTFKAMNPDFFNHALFKSDL